jgi:hypothetical protein
MGSEKLLFKTKLEDSYIKGKFFKNNHKIFIIT